MYGQGVFLSATGDKFIGTFENNMKQGEFISFSSFSMHTREQKQQQKEIVDVLDDDDTEFASMFLFVLSCISNFAMHCFRNG